MSNVVVYCKSSNSDEVLLKCSFVNHLKVGTISESFCAECSHPSTAWGFLSEPMIMQDYVNNYRMKVDIKCSEDEFKRSVADIIKAQVVKTVLLDEKGRTLASSPVYKVPELMVEEYRHGKL